MTPITPATGNDCDLAISSAAFHARAAVHHLQQLARADAAIGPGCHELQPLIEQAALELARWEQVHHSRWLCEIGRRIGLATDLTLDEL
jgi:hypothetical protein